MRKFNSDWIGRNVFYSETWSEEHQCPHYKQYERPLIVCLCGSTRFKSAWYETTKKLTHEGYIVLGVGDLDPNHPNTNMPIDPELKQRLDELHKHKIDLADEILVLNVGGYIGESTRSEVEHAIRKGKSVRWLESDLIPEEFKGGA